MKRRSSRWLAFSWLVLAVLAGCAPTAPTKEKQEPEIKPSANGSSETKEGDSAKANEPVKGTVRVAAASDLRFALDGMLVEFNKKHPGIKVTPTYGSSGNFYAQLSNKAPFDLFLSADINYPRKLIADGHAVKESEFLYGVGKIVVWVNNSSPLQVGLGVDVLKDLGAKKIAIANPTLAPYGAAAEAALKKLGVYDDVKDRLVLGENIAQTAQFVETGAADVGIIALSLALAPTMKDKGRFWEVPTDAYPKLEQGGVILNWAADRAAADELRAFMMSSEGKAALAKFGFDVPGE